MSGHGVNRLVTLVVGVVSVLLGLAGLVVPGSVLGLSVGAAHGVLHLGLGVGLLAASRRTDSAKGAALAVGVTYLALAAAGPLPALGALGLDGAGHVLHAVLGALLTAVALLADRDAEPA